MKKINRFYVYGHYTADTNQLFYIGVGTILNFKTKKHSQIYTRAYHFSRRTKFWKYIANKHGVKIKILFEFANKQDCLDEERKLISTFGRRFNSSGILCNLSSGGEIGPIGRPNKMSEEQKKKLSEIKSITLYIYNSSGIFLTDIKTIKNTAKYCGVTYNAIHSCLQTKNYSNGYFVFKEFKGYNINYTVDNLDFKSPLSKKVITEDINGTIIEHLSIRACADYLGVYRTTVQNALKKSNKCKKHKIYIKN